MWPWAAFRHPHIRSDRQVPPCRIEKESRSRDEAVSWAFAGGGYSGLLSHWGSFDGGYGGPPSHRDWQWIDRLAVSPIKIAPGHPLEVLNRTPQHLWLSHDLRYAAGRPADLQGPVFTVVMIAGLVMTSAIVDVVLETGVVVCFYWE